MTRPTVRLTERRTREVRLPRAEVDFLLAAGRTVIEVGPAFRRGFYRLTPRGFVGFLDGPRVRYAIRPKLPWPNLLALWGCRVGPHPRDTGVSPLDADLLAALARLLAGRMNEAARAGLVRDHHEADAASPFLRGRLRVADQLRDAASRAFPDTFQVTEPVFDLDTPWNRVPKAVASELLRHPDLPAGVQAELAAALSPFAACGDTPVNDSDFAAAAREPRASGYADLLRVCRVVRDGLRAAGGPGSGAFLLDLGRAFEEYVGRVLAEALPRWAIDVQPQLRFDESVSLQPDLILNRGEKCVVLDAKWKRLAGVPEPDDLHQVLAYAAVTGAGHVGLVYPGTRSGRRTIALPNFRLTLFRLRVSGPPADCEASVRRLARAARG